MDEGTDARDILENSVLPLRRGIDNNKVTVTSQFFMVGLSKVGSGCEQKSPKKCWHTHNHVLHEHGQILSWAIYRISSKRWLQELNCLLLKFVSIVNLLVCSYELGIALTLNFIINSFRQPAKFSGKTLLHFCYIRHQKTLLLYLFSMHTLCTACTCTTLACTCTTFY